MFLTTAHEHTTSNISYVKLPLSLIVSTGIISQGTLHSSKKFRFSKVFTSISKANSQLISQDLRCHALNISHRKHGSMKTWTYGCRMSPVTASIEEREICRTWKTGGFAESIIYYLLSYYMAMWARATQRASTSLYSCNNGDFYIRRLKCTRLKLDLSDLNCGYITRTPVVPHVRGLPKWRSLKMCNEGNRFKTFSL